MSDSGSLDALITRKAVEFAEQIRQVAELADKEEEIRIAVERQLAFIEREAGIKLEGRHEFTLAKGRLDSLYSCVIIEYKNPSSPRDKIGPKAEAEAHYLCATLMSAPVQLIVSGYTTTTGISTHVLEHVRVPDFKKADERHQQLSDLSKQCHKLCRDDDPDQDKLAALQSKIDRLAAGLWGITKEELRAVQEALADQRAEPRADGADEED